MGGLLEKLVGAVRQWSLVGLAAVAGYVSSIGADGGFIRDIWGGLANASPTVAMILFVLLMRSEAKREEANRQCNDRTIDFIKSTNLQANSADRTAEAYKELAPALQNVAAAMGLGRVKRRRRRTGSG